MIYGDHLLFRAAAQVKELAQTGRTLRLPNDIAPLVQNAYSGAPLGPHDWQNAMTRARSDADIKQKNKQSLARAYRLAEPRAAGVPGLVGWLDANVGEADVEGARAQVRDTSGGVNVLVVQTDAAGQWRLPDWYLSEAESHHSVQGGWNIEMNEVPTWTIRRALAGTSVSMPDWVCEGDVGDQLITDLEKLMPAAWQQSPDLVGELVLPLDEACQWSGADFTMTYSPKLGLEVRKRKQHG